jgi:hypothetical protein
MLYHCNIGFPLLDGDSEPIGVLAQMKHSFDAAPPRPRDDHVEQVDWLKLAGVRGERVWGGIRNPRLAGGLELRVEVDASMLPNMAVWRAYQSGIFALGIEPCTASSCEPLGAWLQAGESRDYEIAFEVVV